MNPHQEWKPEVPEKDIYLSDSQDVTKKNVNLSRIDATEFNDDTKSLSFRSESFGSLYSTQLAPGDKYLENRHSVLDVERIERMAQLIRQHKEYNTKNIRENDNIPKRIPVKYAPPNSKEAAKITLRSLQLQNINSLKSQEKSSTFKVSKTSSESNINLVLRISKNKQPNIIIENIIDPSTNDPSDIALQLFNESLDGFKKDMVCPIIGKNDDYHSKVLIAYMDFFDFSDISIDEAFRNLCLKLKLIGESQMIDRILFQVSRRYWDCNPKQQDVYGCIDVVYGILFSIVLLNTDLNTVNIGARQHKKMSQKVFVKNTMDLIQVMMESQNENMEHINLMKHWKKEIEQILKDTYHSVKETPILQNVQSIGSGTDLKKSNSLQRSESSWSVSNSVFGSIISNTLGSNKKNASSEMLDIGLNHMNMKEFPNSGHVLLEGILIRKNFRESDGEKPRNRRWVKMWCSVRISHENGVKFMMHRLTNSSSEYQEQEIFTSLKFGDSKTYPSVIYNLDSPEKESELSLAHLNIGERFNSLDGVDSPHPVLSSPGRDYKISNNHPEIFSLIHAFVDSYYHSPTRLHCFSLYLADHSMYLFQAPTQSASNAWISTINYWAARKSREPMRGGVGNVDFGWNGLTETNPNLSNVKLKLAKWENIPISTRLISYKTEDLQLKDMLKQLDLVKKDIVQHESYRIPLENFWSQFPQTSQLAIANWGERNQALTKEYEKYVIYVNALSSSIMEKSNNSPIIGNMKESPLGNNSNFSLSKQHK